MAVLDVGYYVQFNAMILIDGTMVRSWIKIHALSCSGNVGKGEPLRMCYLFRGCIAFGGGRESFLFY